MLGLRIGHAQYLIVVPTLLRPSTLSFSGHKKIQTLPNLGILRWAEGACGVDDEWQTGVITSLLYREGLSSSTFALKHRHNKMVKGQRTDIYHLTQCNGESSVDTYRLKQ